MRELPGQAGHVAEVLVDGKIQVFEIQQTEVETRLKMNFLKIWMALKIVLQRLWEWRRVRATTVLSILGRKPKAYLPSTGSSARMR